MTYDQQQRLSYAPTIHFLKHLAAEPALLKDLQPHKQLLRVFDTHETEILRLRLPLMLPLQKETEAFGDYVDRLSHTIPPYVILLVQAGKAALGYFENGEVVYHKVLQRYAVRRKHGKSQVKHLKKKGSKSAGGQLRMRQTQALFDDVNGKLTEWGIGYSNHPILYYCPTNLWQFFFSAKTAPPFDRKDDRLRKIPRDIRIPSYEELLNTNKQILKGWLAMANSEWEERTWEWLRQCED
jgi:hypothetical protein